MNNTRTGVIDVLRAMGAKIREENAHSAAGEENSRPLRSHIELERS